MAGPAHFPGYYAASDVVLKAIAQHGAAQLPVDALYADALVVHASKLAGLFALVKHALGEFCHSQDDLSLAQVQGFSCGIDQGSLGAEPQHVGFD